MDSKLLQRYIQNSLKQTIDFTSWYRFVNQSVNQLNHLNHLKNTHLYWRIRVQKQILIDFCFCLDHGMIWYSETDEDYIIYFCCNLYQTDDRQFQQYCLREQYGAMWRAYSTLALSSYACRGLCWMKTCHNAVKCPILNFKIWPGMGVLTSNRVTKVSMSQVTKRFLFCHVCHSVSSRCCSRLDLVIISILIPGSFPDELSFNNFVCVVSFYDYRSTSDLNVMLLGVSNTGGRWTMWLHWTAGV